MNIDTDTLQTSADELATERYERAAEWSRLQDELHQQIRALRGHRTIPDPINELHKLIRDADVLNTTLDRIEELEELGV